MRYYFKQEEFDILENFIPSFYYKKVYYLFSLDNCNLEIINSWLSSKKKITSLEIKYQLWLKSFEIYNNLIKLLGFNSENINPIISLNLFKYSNLIQNKNLSIDIVKLRLLNYASVALNSNLNLQERLFYISIIYNIDINLLSDKQILLIETFKNINRLTFINREVFFNCFEMIKKLSKENNDFNEFQFYKTQKKVLLKSFNSWKVLFNKQDSELLQQDLKECLDLLIPLEIINWITGKKTIPFIEDINNNENLEIKHFKGITNKIEAKKEYIKLIRIYHPDLNPNDIEFCTLQTAKINAAWENFNK